VTSRRLRPCDARRSRSARGRGHGAALLAAAIQHARSLVGVSHLHLSVADTPVTARRLYERAALVVDGSTVDVHHMARLLESDLH